MVVRKGCLNEDCVSRRKRHKFKEIDDYFCPKCGNKLYFVCASRNCHVELSSDNEGAYCSTCVKKQEERKQKMMNSLKVVPVAIISTPKLIKSAKDAIKETPEIIDTAKDAIKLIGPKK